MKHISFIALLVIGSAVAGGWCVGAQTPPAEADLLQQMKAMVERMTMEEKIAQITGTRWAGRVFGQGDGTGWMDEKKLAHGMGFICQFACLSQLTPDRHAAEIRRVQQYLRTQTPLGIPALFHDEATSGLAVRGATTFPQQTGMGCTWNPELVGQNTATIRELALKIGCRQVLAPNLDINRNAHWGRIEETYGEDPYLVSRMGLGYVQAMQTADLRHGVAVTLKHFAGYGDGGAAAKAPLWTFREESLRPFEVAIRLGGAQVAMAGYHGFDGKAAVASPELLADILRGQLGFNGVVVSDYGAINQSGGYHLAKTQEEKAVQAISAGDDVELADPDCYPTLAEAVKKGDISEAVIDRAVERVLMLKGRLGMVDKPLPVPTPGEAEHIVGDPPASRHLAYESACQSVVLLKNNGVLPIGKTVRSIAVIGPNAAEPDSLLGDYTYQTLSSFWAYYPINPNDPKLITLLDGLRAKVPSGVKIDYERGCTWTGPLEKSPYVAKAAACDLIIVAVGENRQLCGEGRDRNTATLPGNQEELVRQLAATGKPVVLVYMGGRPPVLTPVEPLCKAVICAWYPGEEGGNALADILLGSVNPSGKLSTTLPRDDKQSPTTYSWGYKPGGMPLYPFGYGLSYTTYAYGGFTAPATIATSASTIPVSFTVANTGACDGVEIAQLYVTPLDIKAPHPAMVLRGFARVPLKAGETKTVTFHVSPQTIAFYDKTVNLAIEPGRYEFDLAASATDIRAKAVVTLAGDPVPLVRRSVFFNEATLSR